MISRAHDDGINVIIMCSDEMYGLVKFLFCGMYLGHMYKSGRVTHFRFF